jgi:hypothetical protein
MLVMTNFTPQNEVSVPMPLKFPRPMLGMTKQRFVTLIGKSTCQRAGRRGAGCMVHAAPHFLLCGFLMESCPDFFYVRAVTANGFV